MIEDMKVYNAVRDKAVVMFCYDDGKERTVEAHGVEIRSGGKRLLIGYQVAGFTKSGDIVGWRAFDIRRISHFRRTGETFTEARRAPTTTEAGQLIEKYLLEGLTSDEIIEKLSSLGTPPSWVREYLSQKQNTARLIPMDREQRPADAEGASCSFCGRTVDEVSRLVSGADACICVDCIKQCRAIIDDD